ncbi:MAG: YihA family ribosome biogenesis GTP-binding protein [Bacteroidetes bacterium]|nr:YihA family ribosome biogenesis GTP-binding protein [Bacteroidota bacterium]
MLVKTANFLLSASDFKQCKPSTIPEYAFIGRSNVGKSTLINMLCNNSKLAHTSATPGKTRLINFFLINNNWHLIDLPGYGFAKIGKKLREGFSTLIVDYCTGRKNLKCLFVLIDSRLELQSIDKEFMEWCSEHNIPFSVVLTKSDKLSKSELAKNKKQIESSLSELWEELPNIFITSGDKKTGKEELLDFIEYLNQK